MALLELDDSGQSLNHAVHSATIFGWPMRRRLSFRRRKLPTARLGGKKPHKTVKLFRRVKNLKMGSLKQKFCCMFKKLQSYSHSLVKDISFQQRMLMEASFAAPVMAISFTSFPNRYALDQHRYWSIQLIIH
ncbi:hypothetical protein ACH5RR_024328 [Cinchona calisaya]|uniref:Uncharacterized protein n=1 Tax=Cinchona calisaya TaxID=153742 RepID=A0ABD2YWB9_9GENT